MYMYVKTPTITLITRFKLFLFFKVSIQTLFIIECLNDFFCERTKYVYISSVQNKIYGQNKFVPKW